MSLNLIVCGFLGSGKTTLIRRMVSEALSRYRVVVVENESGRESVDGIFLRDGGLKVVDLRAGCVCCTLRGEMAGMMARVRDDFDPDCVILEPSGLADLADLLRIPGFETNGVVMLVDVDRFDLLMKLNRDHYLRQFRLAPVMVLTHTDRTTPQQVDRVRGELERINPQALIVEGIEAFDAEWWLETVPERYVRFRTFSPLLPGSGPHFVSRTFPVERAVDAADLKALFERLERRGSLPVRAKGCLQMAEEWMKVDWLPARDLTWTPAGKPACGGFLTLWWTAPEDNMLPEGVCELLDDWIYGTR